MDSIYTIYVNPEYVEFTNCILAVMAIFIVFHLLMAGQKSIGLIGSIFNLTFSETFSKLLVSITFYYLVFRKFISIK